MHKARPILLNNPFKKGISLLRSSSICPPHPRSSATPHTARPRKGARKRVGCLPYNVCRTREHVREVDRLRVLVEIEFLLHPPIKLDHVVARCQTYARANRGRLPVQDEEAGKEGGNNCGTNALAKLLEDHAAGGGGGEVFANQGGEANVLWSLSLTCARCTDPLWQQSWNHLDHEVPNWCQELLTQ